MKRIAIVVTLVLFAACSPKADEAAPADNAAAAPVTTDSTADTTRTDTTRTDSAATDTTQH